MNEVISYDVAKKEVYAWLDSQRVRQRKRDELNAAIESIILSVVDGETVFNNNVPTYTLADPPTSDDGALSLKELTFGNRFTIHDIQTKTKALNVKQGDQIGETVVYISLATKQSSGLITKMHTSDFNMAQLFVAFF